MRINTVAVLLAGFVSLAILSPADARRTVVDQSDPDNPLVKTLSGYCDFNGDDCAPVSIPYSVDFGSGPTNSIVLNGNGVLSFGAPVPFGAFTGSLSDYGVPSISPGVYNETTQDRIDPPGSGDIVFRQSAELRLLPNGVIEADWFYCDSPRFCRFNEYSLLLTPGPTGFTAQFSYDNSNPNFPRFLDEPFLSGFSIPGGPTDENAQSSATSRTLFIPARFQGLVFANPGAVPEPSTWAMMLAGFGLMGAALRRNPLGRAAPLLD